MKGHARGLHINLFFFLLHPPADYQLSPPGFYAEILEHVAKFDKEIEYDWPLF